MPHLPLPEHLPGITGLLEYQQIFMASTVIIMPKIALESTHIGYLRDIGTVGKPFNPIQKSISKGNEPPE